MRFVLIDRFVELDPGVSATAVKTFLPDDEIFRDHFPGVPTVPGTLLVEAMAQTGGWLITVTLKWERWCHLAMIREAKFRSSVAPGTELRISAVMTASHESGIEVAGEVRRGDSVVATARLVYAVRALPPDASAAESLAEWRRQLLRTLGADEALARGKRNPS